MDTKQQVRDTISVNGWAWGCKGGSLIKTQLTLAHIYAYVCPVLTQPQHSNAATWSVPPVQLAEEVSLHLGRDRVVRDGDGIPRRAQRTVARRQRELRRR